MKAELVVAGVLLSLTSCSSNPLSASNYGYLADQKQIDTVNEVFTESADYWHTKLPDSRQIKLATASGKQSLHCSIFPRDYISYCGVTNTINAEGDTFELISSLSVYAGVPEIDVARYAVAHEFGHGIQDITGTNDIFVYRTAKINRKIELQADCLAGKVLATTDSNAVSEIARLVPYISSDTDKEHGSPAQRLEAFTEGFNGSDCGIPA